MNLKKIHFLFLLVIALTLVSRTSLATTDLIVEPNPTDPSHFPSIQSALTYVSGLLSGPTPTTTSFRVFVERGTYAGPITMITNVPIIGRETAETIISGSGTLITATGVSNAYIRNLTFQNATVAVAISTNSTIDVTNNIFRLNTTGVQVQGSPSTRIMNNVFYQNSAAISRDSDIVITNNIFDLSQTAIVAGAATTVNTQYNDYFNNTNDGVALDPHSLPNTTVGNADPKFVDPANNDFHLQSGSPCINAGNNPNSFDSSTSDIGAYGGQNTDTIPFIVSGVASSLTSTSSVSVSWSPNNSYLVKGYHVYYGTTTDLKGTDAAEGPSPLQVASGITSTTLSNLQSAVTVTPSTPVLNQLSPLNNSLVVSWSAAANATSYNVYYSTTPFDASTLPSTVLPVEGNSNTSTTLTGLTNGQTYYVAVSAVASNTFFVAVTALNDLNAANDAPGISNESRLQSPIPQVSFGSSLESPISAVLHDFPEPIVPFPDLPNKGCFIATAAYGYYSAPQVQALRLFRDRYLMPTSAGRAFVAWYYRYGPIGAAFMETHPWLKPLVRVALLPAVGGALFLTGTSLLVKMMFLACFIVITTFILRRRILARSGGTR